MSFFFPARWLGALPAVTALATAAQVAGTPAPEPGHVELPYRSAFESYLGHQDGPSVDWRDANETVRQRGGWRAYAQESAGASFHTHGAQEAPGKDSSHGAHGQQAPANDPHAGHHMPSKARP